MKIEKDAEWQRLEGHVGQLRGKLKDAEGVLNTYAEKYIADQMGLVIGETLVVSKGSTFVVTGVEVSVYAPFIHGRKILKDGQTGAKVQCIYGHWEKLPAQV